MDGFDFDAGLILDEMRDRASHVDTEGWGSLNLKEVGAHKWVEQDYVGMWCFGWWLPGMPKPAVWYPWDPDPTPLLNHIAAGGLFVAHNAPFDRLFWNKVVRRYRPHWPEVTIEQCDCTISRAAAISVPGQIELAAKVLGIEDYEKEAEGEKLVKKYATAAYDKKGNRIWPTSEEIQKMGFYCMKDVVLEHGIAMRAMALSDRERRVWILDQYINDRGFAIDIPLVQKLAELVTYARSRVRERLIELTKGQINSHAQHERIAEWVESRGLPCPKTAKGKPSVAKNNLPNIIESAKAIGVEHYADVMEVLDLKRQGGKSSVDKLFKMLQCVCDDGRLHGQLQYHGAATGRWAGRLAQPHNFYRVDSEKDGDDIDRVLEIVVSAKSPDEAFLRISDLFKEHEVEARRDMIEGAPRKSVMDMAAKCLRSTIIAAPGKKLLGGDKSNIEGRINAWLHEEEWKVEAYRKQDRKEIKDTYVTSYASSFGVRPEDVTGPQRQIGKVCIAEGQLVLTDAGLIPIEKVKQYHLLWDGDTWVKHDGLIYQGIKECIEYDGVTATPDHEVYVEGLARPIQLADAAKRGLRLRRTGVGGKIRRDRSGDERHHNSGARKEHCERAQQNSLGAMRNLRQATKLENVGPDRAIEQRMPALLSAFAGSAMADQAIVCGAVAMREPEEPGLSKLRRPRNSFRVPFSLNGGLMGSPQPTYLPEGMGARSREQRRSLCARQSPVGIARDATTQPEEVQDTGTAGLEKPILGHNHGQTVASRAHGRRDTRNGCVGHCRAPKELARNCGPLRVYDLVNAGPRHRFTVSGRLVSNCELALGYQGSIGAYISMGAGYGVKPENIARIVWDAKAGSEEWKLAEEQYAYTLKMKRQTFGLKPVEWVALKVVVNGWRAAHPKITQGWWSLQDAAIEAVESPGRVVTCCQGRITYMVGGGILWCMLPSGRLLAYCNPRLIKTKGGRIIGIEEDDENGEVEEEIDTDGVPEERIRFQVAYDGFSSQSRKWGFKTLYGGKQDENVVSGLARDCLVEDMFVAEAAGYNIVLTVHDEILCENYPHIGSPAELRAIMNRGYDFAPGLPLEAKTWEGDRYEK